MTSSIAVSDRQPLRENRQPSRADRQPSPEEYRSAAALRAGLRTFSRASEQLLAGHGLTPERFELLLAIKAAENDEPATVTGLCAALGTAQSSVTQLVRRAEDAGLLRREVSSRDARVRHLQLTAQGERRLGSAVTDLREERARLLAVISRLEFAPARQPSSSRASSA